MLNRVLSRVIERGNTEGMAEKLDVFFAAGKLTKQEYMKHVEMLAAKEAEGDGS